MSDAHPKKYQLTVIISLAKYVASSDPLTRTKLPLTGQQIRAPDFFSINGMQFLTRPICRHEEFISISTDSLT